MEFFLKRLLFSLIFLILCNQNIQLLVSLFSNQHKFREKIPEGNN